MMHGNTKIKFLNQFKICTCWGENLAAETGDIARPSRKAGVNEGVASSTTFVRSPVRGRSSNRVSTATTLHKKTQTAFDKVQGGSNMTGTDLCVNKPHCAAAVRP